MCPKRLYTVCLETLVPVADETENKYDFHGCKKQENLDFPGVLDPSTTHLFHQIFGEKDYYGNFTISFKKEGLETPKEMVILKMENKRSGEKKRSFPPPNLFKQRLIESDTTTG
ncbi:hypothetical protein TNCV_2736751 [Trichonephila clavipes]|nr:hypothetical protein TNCV_2736751 [Trichonephila clavipes]